MELGLGFGFGKLGFWIFERERGGRYKDLGLRLGQNQSKIKEKLKDSIVTLTMERRDLRSSSQFYSSQSPILFRPYRLKNTRLRE